MKSHYGAHGIWHPRPHPGILLLGVHSNCPSEEGKVAARPQDNLQYDGGTKGIYLSIKQISLKRVFAVSSVRCFGKIKD